MKAAGANVIYTKVSISDANEEEISLLNCADYLNAPPSLTDSSVNLRREVI